MELPDLLLHRCFDEGRAPHRLVLGLGELWRLCTCSENRMLSNRASEAMMVKTISPYGVVGLSHHVGAASSSG